MGRIPIALQLYSVRRELARDLFGTLQAVARMGYEGVEFAGAPQHRPALIRALLDEAGLVCCGWHLPFELLQEDRLAETIAYQRAVGNRRLIVPGLPASSREDWMRMADYFNRLADRLAPYDLVVGYHNHTQEFSPVDGETPWDIFFSRTDRRGIMQLDFGNAHAGNGDVVAILKKYPGRAGTVHVKSYSRELGKSDRSRGYRPLIGEDELPWPEIFQLCESTGGTDWYIVEYESDQYPPLEAVERFLERLKAMGK